ncbi:ras-specific guanine nucleotide-releasing factor 1 isoform X2 [Nematostella vectensis]|uniref:ras-specific guanine nucleotide-releasing factor 1 isoform X2 n=1 Tax=Nematostella vectensis TaxID=45351 RepID=UPI0020771F4B|nr:ras-specific guanine nucleotide-releasing factor 1 isoform X2 [Nematostella vectensis]
MRASMRISDDQVNHLGALAKQNFTMSGQLYLKATDPGKWYLKWVKLYQNFLFFYDTKDTATVTGLVLLEHSTCERICVVNVRDLECQDFNKAKEDPGKKENCFVVSIPYGEKQQQSITLRCSTDVLCMAWIENIRKSSYAELKLCKEEMEQKSIHLTQVLESERTAKWQLMQQCEEQADIITSLRAEVASLRREKIDGIKEEESEEIKSIKKVQSLIRGWLCRRRWYNIVQDYIRSPHAESMRKRNYTCFKLLETEKEYLENLSTLVSCFFRPFKMAASSKRPPISHEEVSSIFLNSETILFLHQIFFKGLNTRMESWPTLVLGDLFDMLLPMLSIYQEYVRNHHYSLQTLTECKQRSAFNRLLKVYEEKPVCEGRTLESYLTFPMHRVPTYIITLHELLALTPHDHVERGALEYAQSVLEQLSTVMHDEVSETENIRKNLSIERQIAEGCEMLLDVNQIFIRQGSLIQITENRKGKSFGGISLKSSDTRKESVRQCFLFSGYLLLTTRSSSGRLHLGKNGATIRLVDATLVDDCYDEGDGELLCGVRSTSECNDSEELSFRLIVRPKDKGESPLTITLMAPSLQEKAAWTSDISQCIENLTLAEDADTVSVTSRQSLHSVRSDSRLFTDDTEIKYCKALNSCKLPKIRYAKLERLFERLLDVRFLSIDFLNTFLITYRVFTHATNLLDTLVAFYYTRSSKDSPSALSDVFSPGGRKTRSVSLPTEALNLQNLQNERRNANNCRLNRAKQTAPQDISITVSDVKMSNEERESPCEEEAMDELSSCRLMPSSYHSYRRHSSPSALGETAAFEFPANSCEAMSPTEETVDPSTNKNQSSPFLTCVTNVRSRSQSTASDLTPTPRDISTPTYPSLSSSPEEGSCFQLQSPPRRITRHRACSSGHILVTSPTVDYEDPPDIMSSRCVSTSLGAPPNTPLVNASSSQNLRESHASDQGEGAVEKAKRKVLSVMGFSHEGDEVFTSRQRSPRPRRRSSPNVHRERSPEVFDSSRPPLVSEEDLSLSPELPRACFPASTSRFAKIVKDAEERLAGITTTRRPSSPSLFPDRRPRSPVSPLGSPRSPRSPLSPSTNAGVVVTSSKPSRRRSSISQAAAAFAAATAGASTSPNNIASSPTIQRFRFGLTVRHILSHDTHLATMRVLTIVRHWVTKHPEDFETDTVLKDQLIAFMEEILNYEGSSNLEQRFAAAIIRTLGIKQGQKGPMEMDLAPDEVDPNSFDKISSSQLAEQLTFVEHLLFSRVPAHEFLNLAWMKQDKHIRAPNILRVSQRFNETSALVASEILKRQSPSARATVIEKWASVAEVCRNLHNFNSVLEITSAFMTSSVFRLKKTWEKVSKQARSQIEKLQKVVSAEGRFKNMRDALRCADPPCVPYLGFYLTDLAFIEDGTPDCNEDGLVNFSKMRMIAQVIQEIRHYQQTPYAIQGDRKVIHYLTAKELLMDEDALYRTSLLLEPRKRTSSKGKVPFETEI